jgi:hypothetical protein
VVQQNNDSHICDNTSHSVLLILITTIRPEPVPGTGCNDEYGPNECNEVDCYEMKGEFAVLSPTHVRPVTCM